MEDHSRGSENPRSLLVSEWREILSTGASEVDKCQIGEPLRSKGASEVHHSHKKHPQNSLKTQRLLVPEPCTFHYCVGIRVKWRENMGCEGHSGDKSWGSIGRTNFASWCTLHWAREAGPKLGLSPIFSFIYPCICSRCVTLES